MEQVAGSVVLALSCLLAVASSSERCTTHFRQEVNALTQNRFNDSVHVHRLAHLHSGCLIPCLLESINELAQAMDVSDAVHDGCSLLTSASPWRPNTALMAVSPDCDLRHWHTVANKKTLH